MKLEEKLVALRKAKGLSQLQLAEMMDISRQAISRWEVGTAIPSTDKGKDKLPAGGWRSCDDQGQLFSI